MSGTVTGHVVTSLPVRTAIAGVTLIGFEAGGVPVALDPATIPGASGGSGVVLSNSAGTPLGAVGAPGTGSTAARADHVHPRPTAAQIGAAPASHAHSITDVTGLRTELDDLAVNGGAPLSSTTPAPLGTSASPGASLEAARADHVHIRSTAAQIGAAPAVHTHALADVSGLSTALAGKQDTSGKGAVNGYAGLDAAGKVPAAQLPSSLSTANLVNGTVTGQTVAWNGTNSRYEPQTMDDITAVRPRFVAISAPTTLSFASHHGSILRQTAPGAALTLNADQIGTAPDQGWIGQIWNRATSTNTITFGAGISVERMAGATGTGQTVNIAAKGILTYIVGPGDTGGLVAECAAVAP